MDKLKEAFKKQIASYKGMVRLYKKLADLLESSANRLEEIHRRDTRDMWRRF